MLINWTRQVHCRRRLMSACYWLIGLLTSQVVYQTDLIAFLNPDEGFPDFRRLLQLALTVPVANVTAERSFSSMRKIRTYIRSAMGEQRMSSIALLNTEKMAKKTVTVTLSAWQFNTNDFLLLGEGGANGKLATYRFLCFWRFGILQCKLVAVTVTQYYTLQPQWGHEILRDSLVISFLLFLSLPQLHFYATVYIS